jgi:predicted nucleic acid-binding Zn ribbon protein
MRESNERRHRDRAGPCVVCGGPIDPAKRVTTLYCSKSCQMRGMMRKRRMMSIGLTRDGFDRLRAAQDDRCAICDDTCDRLVMDHDHATGAFRGLLCRSCNLLLGHAHDDTSILRAAIEYLGRTRVRSVDSDAAGDQPAEGDASSPARSTLDSN